MAVTLTSPINTATPPQPREIAAADVNGDGRTDLVVMTNGNSSNGHQEQAVVLLGNGQGSFQVSQSFAVGSGPITTGSGQFQNFYAGWVVTGVALGDVNRDGHVDIIRSESGFIPQGQQGRVVVSLGNGNGTFQAGQAFATSGSSEAVTVGDVNGDGKLDIVTVNGRKYNGQSFENAGSISVLLGNGDGTFQGARQIVQGHQVMNVTLAHLNFDQHQDMVTTWWDSSGQGIDLWSGDGTGGFNLLLSIGANGIPGEAAVTFLGPAGVDFSPDILVATSAGLLVVKDIYNAPTYVTSSVISSLSVADLDGDGRADDVVVGGIFDTSYLIGNGNGTFQAAEPLGDPESVAVITAFINGDEWIDIVKVNRDANLMDSPQGSISVRLSDTLPPDLHSIVANTASTKSATITETVTFSEAVTGVDASDFIVTTVNGDATGQIASITGSGATYTVTINGITGLGGLRLDLKATGTGIVDLAGRAITGSLPTGTLPNTVTQILPNTTPAATAATLSTNEDSFLLGHLTGTDTDNDSLTFAIVPNSAANGLVILTDPATGAFTFFPAANFSGTATFQFTASDGNVNGTSAPETVTINVAPVEDVVTFNNPPPSGGLNVNTLATTHPGVDTIQILNGVFNTSGTTNINVRVSGGATLGGSATLGDVVVLMQGMVRPGNSPGTLSMGDVSFEAGALFGAEIAGTGDGEYDRLNVTGTVTLGGATLEASVINGFDPETATGATFTLIDNDGTDAVDGTFANLAEGAVFAISGHSFSITYQGGSNNNDVVLTAVNDAPVMGGDHAITVAEGGLITITTADLTATDPDNAGAQLVFTVTGTSHGGVLLDGAATTSFTNDDVVNGRVSFQHDGGEADGGFTVSLSDGTASGGSATIAATVNPRVNDAPVIGGDHAITVAEGGLIAITTADLTASDVDSTDAQLVFTVTGASHGSVLLNGAATTSFTNDDVVNGRVSFQHDGGEANGDFTVALSDGTASGGSATIATTVDPQVNDAPVIGGDHAITVAEGSLIAITTADLTAADPDNTDAQLVFTVTGASHGGVLLDGAAATSFTQDDVVNGRVSFQHDGGEADGSFTVVLGDGTASGGGTTIAVAVDPHDNDAPVMDGDHAITIAEGGSVAITTADLAATDLDNTDDQLVFTVTGASHGSVLLNGAAMASFTKDDVVNGRVSFQHDGGELDGSFSVALGDGDASGGSATIAAMVNPHVNDAPSVGDPPKLPSIQVNSGAHLITQAALLANASDVDGPSLTAINLQIAKGLGTLVDNQDGTWTYTPKINDDTGVTFSYQVTDGIASVADSATLDILPVQASPETGTPGDDSFTAVTGNSQYDAGSGVDTIAFDFRLVDAVVTWSGNQVIIDGPSSHTVLSGFEVYQFTDGTVNNNDGSPLIDDLFYNAQYHDVWNAQVDADFHYNVVGWKEGRDPSALFDTGFYLTLNPDVRAADVNPLMHYDTAGWKEGRLPSLEFGTQQYLDANPDVKAAQIDPLLHFLAVGAGEGRQPIAPSSLVAANGFDFVYYLQQNPDVAAAHVDPLQHFQTIGWKEGRDPNASFDTEGYLAAYADVRAAGVNPFDHYNQFGWHEGRDPSVNFDTGDYLAANPDVAAAGVNPLLHFLAFGIHEGRSPHADGVWG